MKHRVLAACVALVVALSVCVTYTFPPVVFASAAAARAPQDPSEGKIVEQIEIRGARRIPESSMRLWIQTRENEPYAAEQIRRDLKTVLAQGFFEDAKVYTEEGPRGGVVVIFEVFEYPVILDIDYPGLKSVSETDLLEEWRKRSIGLSKESQLDPVKAQRAAAAIREMLAAKGRPDAEVKWDPERISQTAVLLHFNVTEGPRVRVAKVEFEGNQIFDDGELRGAMQLVKEAGIVAGITSKDIYFREKLDADLQRLRFFYADHGYLRATFGEPRIEDAGKVGSGLPFFGGKDKGLKITIPVEEGRQYKVGEVTIDGETVYPEETIRAVIGLKKGEVVRSSQIQKGVYENLKKLYGERGYLNFTADFAPEFHDDPNDPTTGTADFPFQIEEGKSFALRRIEFKGNTYTRDNVLRREVLLNEGDPYNQRLWDLSILRLNQLGYFNEIKEDDADIRTNDRQANVDIDLRVQEKGRQQVQFTGGVSGVGGSFLGIQYSTSNLLGYGEGLSFQVSAGNRAKIFQFGFSEPYVFGRPVSAGFSLIYSKQQYFGGGVRIGQGGLVPANSSFFAGFGTEGAELFTQTTKGGTISLSAPLGFFFRRSTAARFSRVGLSYTYRTNSIEDPEVNRDDDPNNDILVTYQQPDIAQSTIVPTFTYNSLNASLDPTRGQEFTLGLAFSGGPLGGAVNTIQPSLEYKYFHQLGLISKNPEKPDVFGFRILAGHVRPFGERLDTNSLAFIGGTPVGTRFFLGGEETIRGFDVRSISPVARVRSFVSTRNVSVLNASTLEELNVRKPRFGNRRSVAPSVLRAFSLDDAQNGFDQFFPIGADTQVLANFEYRVPLFGPVAMAAFLDVGSAFNVNKLEDQFTQTGFAPAILSSPFVLNPRGQQATADEIADATTPETPPGSPFPPGFRAAFVTGERQDTRAYLLSEDTSSLFDNYRYSLGTEFRVQVPVLNVPFRLILAYNPNAQVDPQPGQIYREERYVVRFSVGRTF
jgi:outer membrane protein insertion porin family